MRTLTVNDINKLVANICDAHLMINDYGFGPTYNEDLFGNNKYPFIWLELDSSNLNINEQYKFNENGLTFNLYCFDKINLGESNYNDIINDTLYILQTIVQTIQNHPLFRELNLRISNDVTFTPMYEVTDTNVNGWNSVITISQPMGIDLCNSPIDMDKIKRDC